MQRLEDLTDDELADLYAYPPAAEGALVRANFVATLDGSATGDDGRTGSINDPADHRVFEVLRAVSDVVLVGAGTVRDEGYDRLRTAQRWISLRRALGLAEHPVLAVVTRSLDVPELLLADVAGAGGLLVVTTVDVEQHRADALRDRLGSDNLVQAGRGGVDLSAALERLAGSGLRRVLCEGGPHLLNDLARAGQLDELCLTVAPLIVGGNGPRISAGAPLSQAMHLAHALASDGPLLTRWVRG